MCEAGLPPDAHIRCSGKVSVAITALSIPPRTLYADEFKSRESLVDALCASAAIPGLTLNAPYCNWQQHRVIDGGVTDNVPTFSDGVRDQLVVNLGRVSHPFLHSMTPLSRDQTPLVRRGQDDAIQFLTKYLESSSKCIPACGGVECIPASSKLSQGASGADYLKKRYTEDILPWMQSSLCSVIDK